MGTASFIGRELGKALAKFGTKGLKKAVDQSKPGAFDLKGQAIRGYAKNLADDRVSHLVKTPFKVDVQEAIQELPQDKGVRFEYVEALLNKVHKKDEVRAILTYVKSAAASNLGKDERANLVIACLNKLKYIDVIGQFLG